MLVTPVEWQVCKCTGCSSNLKYLRKNDTSLSSPASITPSEYTGQEFPPNNAVIRFLLQSLHKAGKLYKDFLLWWRVTRFHQHHWIRVPIQWNHLQQVTCSFSSPSSSLKPPPGLIPCLHTPNICLIFKLCSLKQQYPNLSHEILTSVDNKSSLIKA